MLKALQITSATNAQFRIWKTLLTSKGIRENNCFFLMGEKLVAEFLKTPPAGFQAEYILHDAEIPQNVTCKKTFLSKELFQELDVLGTHAPMLVVSYQDFAEKDFAQKPQGLELLCPLGDPRNLGALIRSAAGFGAREIILTKESTHPFLPHSIKASAGAALQMRFSRTRTSLAEIPLVGENMALSLFGKHVTDVRWPADMRLWVGEEGPGLSLAHEQKKKIQFIHIPTADTIESLNATVSISVAMWEWKKSQT